VLPPTVSTPSLSLKSFPSSSLLLLEVEKKEREREGEL
jgi:hypothetical protein